MEVLWLLTKHPGPSTCIQFDGLKLHLNVYQVNFFGRNIFSTWANFPGQSIPEAWTCVLLQHISKLSMLDHNLSFPHKFTLGIFRRQFLCFCLLSSYFIRFWIIKTELFACTILSWNPVYKGWPVKYLTFNCLFCNHLWLKRSWNQQI